MGLLAYNCCRNRSITGSSMTPLLFCLDRLLDPIIYTMTTFLPKNKRNPQISN